MPIYEYGCAACGHRFDHLARTLSAPSPNCPECGASGPEKQLSTFSASVGARADHCSLGTCPSGECAGGRCPLG